MFNVVTLLRIIQAIIVSSITITTTLAQRKDAIEFLRHFNIKFASISAEEYEAMYRRATNITDHNLQLQIKANAKLRDEVALLVKKARQINLNDSDADVRRQFQMILTSMTSFNKTVANRVSEILTEMENAYNTGSIRYKPNITKSLDVEGITELTLDEHLRFIMASSNDSEELLYVWKAWRDAVGPKVRKLYEEYVRLNNIGARENGFVDAGDFKRKLYEVENLEEISEKILDEMQPLYRELHAYVRYRLTKKYPNHIGSDGLIPAHLLGNMWAQYWVNIFDDVAPYPDEPTLDVTRKLKEKHSVVGMFKMAEDFFVSLGWPRLPDKFWTHSLFVQPDDRKVECHASAWDFWIQDQGEPDVRVKMCTKKTQEDFIVVHHELGHIYYFLFYWHLPMKYRDGANPAFHEAVGDILALSVRTPTHLKAVKLLDNISPTKEADMNFLLMTSLEYIAFLPFGFLMDKWMWDVYSGHIKPEEYNTKWWEYRRRYQGIKAPINRTEDDFDPGGKLHISADVPFIRYFLSCILQFTFHKQACTSAGKTGPLHQCSIYQSKEAGKGLREMLSLGKSKPWPEVLEQYTGSKEISTEPIKEYFKPLIDWLKEYRAKHQYKVGWHGDMIANHTSRLSTPSNVILLTLIIICIFLGK